MRTDRHDQLARDARAWLTVRLGDALFVPEPVRHRSPAEIVAAAHAELALLSRCTRARANRAAARRIRMH